MAIMESPIAAGPSRFTSGIPAERLRLFSPRSHASVLEASTTSRFFPFQYSFSRPNPDETCPFCDPDLHGVGHWRLFRKEGAPHGQPVAAYGDHHTHRRRARCFVL